MDTCVSNDKVDFDAGHRETLAAYLERWAADEPARRDIAVTVEALAKAAMAISGILALGALSGPLGAVTGKQGGADPQRELDVLANDRIIASLAGTPVALLVSEELDDPLPIRDGAPLILYNFRRFLSLWPAPYKNHCNSAYKYGAY